MTGANKVIFLDRDGTLIVNKHYLCDPREVEFCPDVINGLKHFQEWGFHIVIVTNQSGIGRGYFSLEAMHQVHTEIISRLIIHGIEIEAFLFCPHRPDEDCDCRKPKIGMIHEFEKLHPIDYNSSFVVGDSLCDIELGRNLGIKSILYSPIADPNVGLEEAQKMANYTALNWRDISRWISTQT